MKLEEIQALWDEDTEIDITDLDRESIKISKLHSKYYRIYSLENLHYKKLESDLKELKFEKHEFFTNGATSETLKKGWKLPPKGVILKTELPMYLEADKDIINLTLRLAIQKEKVDFLESIIKSLTNRGYNIKSAVDFIRFKSGN